MDRAAPNYEEFVKVFVMYLLSTQILRSFAQVRVLYLIVTAALGVHRVRGGPDLPTPPGTWCIYKRGFAGLDNNGAALMLAMGIPLCFFAWEFTRGYHRWAYLAAIPFLAEAVMSSYSRGAMVSALAVAPFYLLYSRKRRILLIAFAVAAVAVPVVAGKEIKERFSSAERREFKDDSFASRLVSWDCARRIANDYPVFGAGIAVLEPAHPGLRGRPVRPDDPQPVPPNRRRRRVDRARCGTWALVGTGFGAMWAGPPAALAREADPDAARAVAVLGGIECVAG